MLAGRVFANDLIKKMPAPGCRDFVARAAGHDADRVAQQITLGFVVLPCAKAKGRTLIGPAEVPPSRARSSWNAERDQIGLLGEIIADS
jgi:hypothetical protein